MMNRAAYSNDGPTQNVIFATKDNHIGYFANGAYPMRKYLYQGAYILDGTNK